MNSAKSPATLNFLKYGTRVSMSYMGLLPIVNGLHCNPVGFYNYLRYNIEIIEYFFPKPSFRNSPPLNNIISYVSPSDMNLFIYSIIYLFVFFVYIFICLFIVVCLFVCLFVSRFYTLIKNISLKEQRTTF